MGLFLLSACALTQKQVQSKYLLPGLGAWRGSPGGRVCRGSGAAAPAHRPKGLSSSGQLSSAWCTPEHRVQLGKETKGETF